MTELEKAIMDFECSIGIIGESGPARRYVEDLKIVIAAASKQIPHEPAEETMPDGTVYMNCPECGEYLCRQGLVPKGIGKYIKHCSKCGKKILWPTIEEM